MSPEEAARRIVALAEIAWNSAPFTRTYDEIAGAIDLVDGGLKEHGLAFARAYLAALKVVEAARALDKVIAEFPDYPAAWAECIAAQETALAAYDKEAGR